MLKRKYIIAAIVLITCVFLLKFLGYYEKEGKGLIGFCGRLLNKTNTFTTHFQNINTKDIDIVWVTENQGDTLVSKGNTVSNFNYDYGPENFIVLYQHDILCSEVVWSTNNNDAYDMDITVSQNPNGILVAFKVKNDFEHYLREVHIDTSGQKTSNKVILP